MTDWVPVVDISRHQGAVDFRKMRAAGVKGLILRISHGLTLDDRAETYYPDAINAGFDPAEVGWYPFINPKRGTATQTAAFAIAAIERITGSLDFFYMLDIENYQNESPNAGTAPVYGERFAAYIREHISTVNLMAPKSRVLGYTNRAYWNGKVSGTVAEWVGDDQLASELDFIVARYPAYSLAAYQRRPLPATPAGWADWAFTAAPDGPFPPRGGTWLAWQFSAGYNRQGAAYGVSSSDLDLNIVHPDAWARWTGRTTPVPVPIPTPVPQPQQEDDMLRMLALTDSPVRLFAMCDNVGRALRCEWTGPGDASGSNPRIEFYRNAHPAGGVPFEMGLATGSLINVSLDGALPPGLKPEVFANPAEIIAREAKGIVDEEARARVTTLETVSGQLNDSVGRLGQSVGDIQTGLIRAGGGH